MEFVSLRASFSSVKTLNGRTPRFMCVTVSLKIFVPNLELCSLRAAERAERPNWEQQTHNKRQKLLPHLCALVKDVAQNCENKLRPLVRQLLAAWRGTAAFGGSKRKDKAHLNLSQISPPRMPSGKPGKFSTSVVVVSCSFCRRWQQINKFRSERSVVQ